MHCIGTMNETFSSGNITVIIPHLISYIPYPNISVHLNITFFLSYMDTEHLMLIISLFALFFFFFYKKSIKKIKHNNLLAWSLTLFIFACILTILEDYMLYSICNFMEHLCYLASTIFLVVWSLKYQQNRVR